jgi:hypothetical protein
MAGKTLPLLVDKYRDKIPELLDAIGDLSDLPF